MIDFKVKQFKDLNTDELYEILRLRSEVFIVEQDCVYQDIDNYDPKALHIIGSKKGKIIAYARIFKKGDYFEKASLGRVIVKKSERSFGYGHQLIDFSIKTIEKEFKTRDIKISAQLQLKEFYESHGFKAVGKAYLEDGLKHIEMRLNNA